MKTRILTLILIIASLKLLADSAQPGVWGAGGIRDFTLLYPEDSTAYKKIQMKKEFVSIQLYKGYAVVKGEYWMYNSTPDTLQIKTGYPLNSSINVNDRFVRTDMLFDSLSQLNVFVDGNSANIISTPGPKTFDTGSRERYENTNWYVWVTKFKPKGYTKIVVYFIVNTNNTGITSGYDHASYNGFIYILESGSTWKQPIEQGTVVVQLMDNLEIKDVHGVEPPSIFMYNDENKLLKYTFSNLSPGPENNIIITYNDQIRDFSFQAIFKNKQSCFQAIDKLSQTHLEALTFKSVTFQGPLNIPSNHSNPATILILGFAGIIILTALIVSVVVIVVVRISRKRRAKKE